MRSFIRKITLGSILLMGFASAVSLQSCKDDDEAMKWVDLRYRVDQDAYVVGAQGQETISFLVKSTDKWEVFGSKREEWYHITPETGEPGQTFEVTITCSANTDLDDRMDTINIKSDYWLGKQFTLMQKGTAYLNYEEVEMLPQEEATATISVLSNQKWTAEVTEGNVWLSITQGASGEADGGITVSASANSGEQRTGVIAIYDRYGVLAQEVSVTQAGVILTPQEPENGKWFAVYEEAQTLIIPVESNAKWTVAKETEEDNDWYELATTSFDGSGDLTIVIAEHKGTAVRTGTLVLSTVAEEGATPLVKKIRFKQANPLQVDTYPSVVLGSYSSPENLRPGLYHFYFDPFELSGTPTGSANNGVNIFYKFGAYSDTQSYEVRIHVTYNLMGNNNTWTTDFGCMPYNESMNKWVGKNKPIDVTKPFKLSFDIHEAIDAKGNSCIYTAWYLNDTLIVEDLSDGIVAASGKSCGWKIPWSEFTSTGGSIYIQAYQGAKTMTKWEYVAPLDWGE